jgi:hypothetical protein
MSEDMAYAYVRLEAMLRWLLEDGHITAQGARQIRKIIESESEGGGMGEDMARLKMVTELDVALHGETVARDQTPQEVWYDLLGMLR